jgi:hypothetical protein
MTKVAPRRLLLVVFDQPVMPGEPRQGDLQNDLARPLGPTVLLLGVLEAFQLATDIDQHAGDFQTHGHEHPHDPLLRGDDSSRSAAAFDGAARRERSEGASADQVEITRGLRCANQ